jgi:hypothetical protein
MVSRWRQGIPTAGGTPTLTYTNTDRTTVGALNQVNGGGTALRIVGIRVASSSPAILIAYDRLGHMGGLSGNVLGGQTVSSGASHSRYTNGVGVAAFVEINTAIGATIGGDYVTNYTADDGTSGHTNNYFALGGAAGSSANTVIPIPLNAGHKGVRSTELLGTGGTLTGTAGNIGVFHGVLLGAAVIPAGVITFDYDAIVGGWCGGLPEVLDDACLAFMTVATTSAAPSLNFEILLSED